MLDQSYAVNTYPELIQAAEAPVIDTSCVALLQLARRVHECGQKVVLTGEGADEWLVGYPWYKAAKLIEYLDILPGREPSFLVRLRLRLPPSSPFHTSLYVRATHLCAGGTHYGHWLAE